MSTRHTLGTDHPSAVAAHRRVQSLDQPGTHATAVDVAVTMVVPVYNERHRFDRYAEPLAEFVRRQPPGSELVFVDDGSTDGTGDIVDTFERRCAVVGHRVHALHCPHRGKGAAVRAGLQTAASPVAGFCDLDLSVSLPSLARLIDAAREAETIAIASRHVAAARVSHHQGPVRQVLGRSFNTAVRLALVRGVVDTQCGAKVAQTRLWDAVLPRCQEDGFAWDVELLAVAIRMGIPVREIGVAWRHQGGSKVRVARDGADMLRALARIRRNVNAQFRSDAPAPTVVAAVD
jgi:dolichyl-phosphate beta-glucosyltransferase